jgi:hypothetical protein
MLWDCIQWKDYERWMTETGEYETESENSENPEDPRQKVRKPSKLRLRYHLTKFILFLALLLAVIFANGQQIDLGAVNFVDGHLADSAAVKKLLPTDIHDIRFFVPYGYPAGANYIRTTQFVDNLRPTFFKNLKIWAKDNTRVFIVDEKPMNKQRLIQAIKEKDIEGFNITSDGKKEHIEIFLTPGFALNCR